MQTEGISLQLFYFLAFQKLRPYFSIRAGFFLPISEIPQGISRKMETFATRPRTENWVVSSFHLVQPLLPALWDESPRRSDKAS